MKSVKALLTIATVISLQYTAQGASMFTDIFVFGDSLTDTGNVFAATGGATPPAPYWEGRFSNGPNLIDQLATNHLNLSAPTPSLAGGTNHAFGGAFTATNGDVPSVLTQVQGYVGGGGTFAATDLVVLWGGANDFLSGGVTDPSLPVASLSEAAAALVGAGANTLLIPNLPDLSDTPAISGMSDPAITAGMHALTSGFNTLLSIEVASLRGSLDADFFELDIFTLGKQITTDPNSLGLVNGTDSALFSGVLGPDANTYAYWDTVHPTEAVHGLFAGDAARVLGVPEPSSALLLWVGVSGLLLRRRRAFHC